MVNQPEDFSQLNISNEEKEKLVAEVIRHVLFKTYQTSGCPIKRDELTQIITKNYRQRTLPGLVIREAAEKLSDVFGLELRELQRSRTAPANQAQTSVADAKFFIITSRLPTDIYSKYVFDENASHLAGFTFVVVSVIHLVGGKIQEEALWHYLKQMGLYGNGVSHPILGDIKVALESLVQQRYLHKEKMNGPEGHALVYELSERSLDGSVVDKIKAYISQTAAANASMQDP